LYKTPRSLFQKKAGGDFQGSNLIKKEFLENSLNNAKIGSSHRPKMVGMDLQDPGLEPI